MKSLTISENRSNNPLQEAAYDSKNCSRRQPLILKIVPKAGYDTHTGEKLIKDSKGKQEHKFLCDFRNNL
jgi:hypothetical protein